MLKEIEIKIDGLIYRGFQWHIHENQQDLLCLHGWLDNANSFLDLAKNLNHNLIALDLPGQGLSDHLEDAAHYHMLDSIYWIEKIRRHFQWEKVNFLCHSLGGVLASIYAGCFPEHTKQVISIDSLGPISNPADKTQTQLRNSILSRIQIAEKGLRVHDSKQSCIQARCKSGHISYSAAELLIDRACKEIKGKWYWNHDYRLSIPSALRMSNEQCVDIFQNIECPFHLIKAKNGFELVDWAIKSRAKYIKNFHLHQVEGGHHVHMENAPLIANIICKII